MGKRGIIQSAINIVVLISYHKILYKQGEKLESKRHLENEIKIYTEDGFEKTQEYKFNEIDLEEIKEKSVRRVLNVLTNKYPDVKFTKKEVYEFVEDTMDDLF